MKGTILVDRAGVVMWALEPMAGLLGQIVPSTQSSTGIWVERFGDTFDNVEQAARALATLAPVSGVTWTVVNRFGG